MISTTFNEISQTTNLLAKKVKISGDEDIDHLEAIDLAKVEGEGALNTDSTPSYFVERNEFLSTISRLVNGDLVLHERELECFLLLVMMLSIQRCSLPFSN
jgi:hypothetical protein